MIESKGWILLALAFAVLLVLLNLSTIEEKASTPLFGKETEDKFDYEMQGMQTRQYNIDGVLTSTLSADKLIHFPGKKVIELTAPSLLFSVSEQLWRLNAETGSLFELSEELVLDKWVRINNIVDNKSALDGATHPAGISIEVNQLTFNLQQQIASSPNQVKISSADWSLQGEGLSIDVKKQTLKILNKVEALHENR